MSQNQNPHLVPPEPPKRNATVQPGASDFVETPDVPAIAPSDHHPLPIWLYLVCGAALFLAGSSFTGFGGPGMYDSGPGAPLVASSSSAAATAPLSPLELGKQVYSGNCANCHQASGEGQPGQYPPLAGSEWVNGDTSRLYGIMLHGLQGPLTVKGGAYGAMQMPGWATVLNDEKIADVMTYIRASWGNTAGPVTAADVSAARAKLASHSDAYTMPDLMKMSGK